MYASLVVIKSVCTQTHKTYDFHKVHVAYWPSYGRVELVSWISLIHVEAFLFLKLLFSRLPVEKLKWSNPYNVLDIIHRSIKWIGESIPDTCFHGKTNLKHMNLNVYKRPNCSSIKWESIFKNCEKYYGSSGFFLFSQFSRWFLIYTMNKSLPYTTFRLKQVTGIFSPIHIYIRIFRYLIQKEVPVHNVSIKHICLHLHDRMDLYGWPMKIKSTWRLMNDVRIWSIKCISGSSAAQHHDEGQAAAIYFMWFNVADAS